MPNSQLDPQTQQIVSAVRTVVSDVNSRVDMLAMKMDQLATVVTQFTTSADHMVKDFEKFQQMTNTAMRDMRDDHKDDMRIIHDRIDRNRVTAEKQLAELKKVVEGLSASTIRADVKTDSMWSTREKVILSVIGVAVVGLVSFLKIT